MNIPRRLGAYVLTEGDRQVIVLPPAIRINADRVLLLHDTSLGLVTMTAPARDTLEPLSSQRASTAETAEDAEWEAFHTAVMESREQGRRCADLGLPCSLIEPGASGEGDA